MGGAQPVLGASGAVLRQPLVQVVAQVLPVQHVDRAAHIEQLALHGVGQGALAGAGEAAEQYGRRLLAEAAGTLLARHMGIRTVMSAAAMGRRRSGDDHAGANGAVGQAIDDDEGAGGAVLLIAIERDGRVQADLDPGDLVQLQLAARGPLQSIHVHLVDDARNRTRHIAGSALDIVLLARKHRLLGHPHQHGIEAVGDQRAIVGMHQHVAAGNVDLVFQGQGDGLAGTGLLQFALEGDDGFHLAALARRQCHHFVALAHHAAGQGAGETAEVQVRPVHVLHREAHVIEVAVGGDLDGFEDFHQRLAGVPGRTLGLVDHVVALERRHRHEVQRTGLQTDLLGKGQVVGLDLFEDTLVEVLQVHLVDGDHDMPDTQQGRDETVPAGLGLHTVAGIDQDDRQVAGRGTGSHVAGVLLMAGRVGDDELALGGAEVAVRHIDSDALLALGLQAIDQQRQVDVVARGADFLRVAGDGLQVILVDHLGVVQQAPDQGALAVIDVAAGKEAQQFLAFVLPQVGEDVLADQIGLMRHAAYPQK